MQVLDFPRSFVTWRIDIDELPPRTLSHRPPYPMNNSRIPLESRCRITDGETGVTQTFVLGASCKTEQVGAERDLFLLPNADFLPIISDDSFMHLKTWARVGTAVHRFPPGAGEQPDRLRVPLAGTFVSMRLDLVEREAVELPDARAIVEATFAGDPLVVHTVIQHGRYTATIEFPVKTDERQRARVDLPDRHGPGAAPRSRCGARGPDGAPRRRVRGPQCTRLDRVHRPAAHLDRGGRRGLVEVYHYSEPVRVDGVQNTFYRIPQDAPATSRRVDLEGGNR